MEVRDGQVLYQRLHDLKRRENKLCDGIMKKKMGERKSDFQCKIEFESINIKIIDHKFICFLYQFF